MNNSRNRKMTIILAVLIVMLLSIALYMAYFTLFKANYYASHDFNARNWVDESQIQRGTIRDRDGNSLAFTKKTDDKDQRINNYNYIYSSVIGYSSKEYGKTGIEQRYNKQLLNIPDNYDFISQLEENFKKSDKGQDVYLTIDSKLQEYMYNLLNGYKGAIVVMEPETGNILAMVSRPTFNVNQLKENWESMISSEDGVMINRATQGLYPPGSTFKIISAITLIEKGVDLDYEDKGKTTIDGYTINNYKNRILGKISLREALIKSSNAYFSDKSKELDNKDYLAVTNRFMFGQDFDFDISRNKSRIPFEKNISQLEKAVAAFGQGKTLVTPLDMASMISAIANDGKYMKPRLVDKTVRNGNIYEIDTKILSLSIKADISSKMKELLTETAKGNKLTLSDGRLLAGKSGTAETKESSNLWYVGYGPSDKAKYAMAIVLEDTGLENGHIASRMFVDAMNYMIKR